MGATVRRSARSRAASPSRVWALLASVCAVAVLVVMWFLTSDASPLHAWARSKLALGAWLTRINLLPHVLAAKASGSLEQPSAIAFYLAAFVQWFLIAFSLIAVWKLARRLIGSVGSRA